MHEQDLKALFETEIEPKIRLAEAKWSSSSSKTAAGVMLLVLSILCFVFIPDTGKLLGVPFVVAAIAFFANISYPWRDYKADFKDQVIRFLVHHINPDWQYLPTGKIEPAIYHYSGLFKRQEDRYYGDDLIKGKIGQTDFESSEIHTEYKTVEEDDDGHRKVEWHTIFYGLFFHADFNKHFKGHTYVMPDFSEKTFGNFGRNFQRFSSKGQLVQLENIEFEKEFVVHSSDQIEARYIITPAIMEAMLELRRHVDAPIFFAFVGSRVYCAIAYREALYEPHMRKELQFERFKEFYQLIAVNAKIVEELELNTRIWAKE